MDRELLLWQFWWALRFRRESMIWWANLEPETYGVWLRGVA